MKKLGKCDRSENVWRRLPDSTEKSPVILRKSHSSSTEFNYLTYDLKTKGIGYSVSIELLKILKAKKLCDEFMKFMNHPAYVLGKRFKKPVECESEKSESDEEEKIEKIVKGHFNGGRNNGRFGVDFSKNNRKKFLPKKKTSVNEDTESE